MLTFNHFNHWFLISVFIIPSYHDLSTKTLYIPAAPKPLHQLLCFFEAFFVWSSAEPELQSGTGISHHVTRYCQRRNLRFLAGRSARRHSGSRSWRSEVAKHHWLFCAPWQEHHKHPSHEYCTKEMNVSHLLTFSNTAERLLSWTWLCFSTWIDCLVTSPVLWQGKQQRDGLCNVALPRNTLPIRLSFQQEARSFSEVTRAWHMKHLNLVCLLESMRALLPLIEMIKCALNSQWLLWQAMWTAEPKAMPSFADVLRRTSSCCWASKERIGTWPQHLENTEQRNKFLYSWNGWQHQKALWCSKLLYVSQYDLYKGFSLDKRFWSSGVKAGWLTAVDIWWPGLRRVCSRRSITQQSLSSIWWQRCGRCFDVSQEVKQLSGLVLTTSCFRYGMIWMSNFPWMDEDSSEICSLHNEPASFGDLHGWLFSVQEIKGHQQSPLLQAFFQHVVAGQFNPPSKPAVGVSFEHFDFEPSPAPAKFEAGHFKWVVTFLQGFEGFTTSYDWSRHGRLCTKTIVTAVWLPGEPTNLRWCRWFEPPMGIHAGDLILHNGKVAGPAAIKNGSTPGDGRSRHSIGAFRRWATGSASCSPAWMEHQLLTTLARVSHWRSLYTTGDTNSKTNCCDSWWGDDILQETVGSIPTFCRSFDIWKTRRSSICCSIAMWPFFGNACSSPLHPDGWSQLRAYITRATVGTDSIHDHGSKGWAPGHEKHRKQLRLMSSTSLHFHPIYGSFQKFREFTRFKVKKPCKGP